MVFFRRFRKSRLTANIFLLAIGFLLLHGCQQTPDVNSTQEKEHPNITKLKNQSTEFEPDIVKLGENVYVAVGYDGSNASMVIGDDGVVIVDALRALGAAEKVAAEFRKITSKPVRALIYTHGHADHTGGASAFIGSEKDVKIIAREGFKDELQDRSPVEPVLKKRNARQFGRDLPAEDVINRGVAAGVTPTDRVGEGYIEPNLTFQGSLNIKLAGLDFELHAADGETNDESFLFGFLN